MKDLLKKLEDYIKNNRNKKTINNLFIILIIIIIFLIFINNYLSKGKLKDDNKIEKFTGNLYVEVEDDYNTYLENKLGQILSKISGVGQVHVMITLEDSEENILASNSNLVSENTLEDDGEGGIREINREDASKQIVTRASNGDLLVVKKINPNIQGVIVIAQGANDLEVKEILYEAVKTVLGIKGNKVQVFTSK